MVVLLDRFAPRYQIGVVEVAANRPLASIATANLAAVAVASAHAVQ